jgi:hypothetical protein
MGVFCLLKRVEFIMFILITYTRPKLKPDGDFVKVIEPKLRSCKVKVLTDTQTDKWLRVHKIFNGTTGGYITTNDINNLQHDHQTFIRCINNTYYTLYKFL